MSFYEVANHPLIYAMVICGIAFVALFCIVSLRKSWKRAIVMGYSKDKLWNIVKTSASATIMPSFAVVIGFFTLTTILGIPWPWWRLSVLGSVTYETMAANMAVQSTGLNLGELSVATARDFVLVMFVMSIGIVGGLTLSIFISKRIQTGTISMTSKDQRWGALGSSMFFLVICAVFVIPAFVDYSHKGLVTLLTLFTSAGLAVGINIIATRFKISALKMFNLAVSMLLAMASSVLWDYLLPK
ncbi:MAG: DUF5058 family protein [Spirochaetaceae bacterium]|jgi:hypothetical protein|nr:DUF5058 family protein [Spirochaetaceae bacterium]